MIYAKKIISAVILSLFISSTSLAYSPTIEDNKILDNFYEKVNNLHNNSPEKLNNILKTIKLLFTQANLANLLIIILLKINKILSHKL